MIGTFCLAAVVDRFGIERVLTASLALATLTLLAIGQLDPRNWQLIALLLGAGLGGSSQGGISGLCGLIYPLPCARAVPAHARARIRGQSDIHGGGNVSMRRRGADGDPRVPTRCSWHRRGTQPMNDEAQVPPQAFPDYLLGSTDAEHERLIRQAARLAPATEAFFREAGIGAGQRVLDVGSGVGDVAMLLARLVGSTGAVVGRYVLQFLPHPAGVLRRLSQSLRGGGIAAFLECSFAPFMALSAHPPLWSTAVRLMHEISTCHGVRMEMGPELLRTFTDAGLPAPHMRLYMELGHDPNFTRWLADVLRTLRPQFSKFRISADPLGDLDTLEDRLHAEVASSKTVVPWLSMVGAYARHQTASNT